VNSQEVDIWTGSLAKGLLAACCPAVCFIFAAALCPSAAAAVIAALGILKEEPERVARLHRNADFLREGLKELGYDTGASQTPIVPVVFHDEAAATIFAACLRNAGILTTPVMFPAVPQGAARLRLCATAAHSIENLEFALDAFRQLKGGNGSKMT
jgi:glycine C-acetyltransferase